MSGQWTSDDDVTVGTMPPKLFRAHGPIVQIGPYPDCPFAEGWRIATFADGHGITLEPGGWWPEDAR